MVEVAELLSSGRKMVLVCATYEQTEDDESRGVLSPLPLQVCSCIQRVAANAGH